MCGCDCIGQPWNKNRANHMGKCYELIEKNLAGICGSALVNHPAKILTGEMK